MDDPNTVATMKSEKKIGRPAHVWPESIADNRPSYQTVTEQKRTVRPSKTSVDNVRKDIILQVGVLNGEVLGLHGRRGVVVAAKNVKSLY